MDYLPSNNPGDRLRPEGDDLGFEASEDIGEGDAVSLNADGTIALAQSGDYVLGSAAYPIAAGEGGTIRVHGAVGYNVEAGVSAGEKLEAGTDGVLAAMPGDGTGTESNLMAMTPESDGEAAVLRV